MTSTVSFLMMILAAMCLVLAVAGPGPVVVRADADGDDDAAESSHATDDSDDDSSEGPKSTEAEGVSTAVVFPDSPSQQGGQISFNAATDVNAVVGVSNNAEGGFATYRVEYVLAYLTMRENPGFYVQNFTGSQYRRNVAPGETVSVKYRFQPDASLDSQDYNFVLQVFYLSEDNETYLATPFNGTVTITDNSSSLLDGRTLFAYGSVLAIFGMLGGALYTKVAGGSKKRSTVAGGVKSADGIDWDYVPKEHRQYVRARSHTPKKSNSPSPATAEAKKKN